MSDNFTEQARAEAERLIQGDPRFTHTTRDLLVGMAERARDRLRERETDVRAAGYVEGWADALAQEPTDAEVEAAKSQHERHSQSARRGELGGSYCLACGHEYTAHTEGKPTHAIRAALTAAQQARNAERAEG